MNSDTIRQKGEINKWVAEPAMAVRVFFFDKQYVCSLYGTNASDNGLVWMRARILALEENLFRMKDWKKSICKKNLEMDVTFRDESNDGN